MCLDFTLVVYLSRRSLWEANQGSDCSWGHVANSKPWKCRKYSNPSIFVFLSFYVFHVCWFAYGTLFGIVSFFRPARLIGIAHSGFFWSCGRFHWIRRIGKPTRKEVASIVVSNHISFITPFSSTNLSWSSVTSMQLNSQGVAARRIQSLLLNSSVLKKDHDMPRIVYELNSWLGYRIKHMAMLNPTSYH